MASTPARARHHHGSTHAASLMHAGTAASARPGLCITVSQPFTESEPEPIPVYRAKALLRTAGVPNPYGSGKARADGPRSRGR